MPATAAPAPVPAKPGNAPVKPVEKPHLIVQVLQDLFKEGKPEVLQIVIRDAIDSPDLDRKVQAQVAVFDGLLRVDLGDEKAPMAFNRAFEKDYYAVLPADASPPAVQMFKTVQAEYRKTHAPPVPPKPPEPDLFKGNEWKWGLLGGGAAGAITGIAVLAGSNGQQNTFGGALVGAGALGMLVGLVALVPQEPAKGGTAVSFAVTPHGDVLAAVGTRF